MSLRRFAITPSRPRRTACRAAPRTAATGEAAAQTMKKLYLETVGCQMNVLDSELVVGSLRRQGYQLVHDPAGADLLLFNTCSVREHAEEKIYSALGRIRKQKVERPGTVVGVLGCMAQKDQDIIFK